jgi:hypothetical protein
MIKQPARTHHPRDRYLPNVAVECAKRWKQCLDPQLDRSEWTEDDVCLTSLWTGTELWLKQRTEPSAGRNRGRERETLEGNPDGVFSFAIPQYH